MKKSLAKYFACFANIDTSYVEEIEEEVLDTCESDLDKVINEIFSVDERTGLPKGDIQYYLSAEGNPTVKLWLENNLLSPRSVRTGSSIDDVSDDLIEEMTRRTDESFEDYVSRLDLIRNEAVLNSGNNG